MRPSQSISSVSARRSRRRAAVASRPTAKAVVEAVEPRLLKANSRTAIGVQFFLEDGDLATTDVAGVVPQRNFNDVPINFSSGTSGTTGALVNGAGIATAITLTHRSHDGSFTSLSTSTPNNTLLQSEDKSGPVNHPGTQEAATYTFNHVPAGTYTLIAYTQADAAAKANVAADNITYYVNDQTDVGNGSPAFVRAQNTDDTAARDTGNYVRFDAITPDANGAITLSNFGDVGSSAVNGLQLIPTDATQVTATLNGSILTIAGTAGTDKIGVDLHKGRLRVAALARGGPFASFDPATVSAIVIDAGAASDRVDVDATVTIDATITGGGGNDVLFGGSGNDSLMGGSGRDRLIGRLGSDALIGGTGSDTVEYGDRDRRHPVNVSLDRIGNDGDVAGEENDFVAGDIENVIGGQGNDTITGNSGDNILVGNRGADFISDGGGGEDTLVGYFATRTDDGAVDTLDGDSQNVTFINDSTDVLQNTIE